MSETADQNDAEWEPALTHERSARVAAEAAREQIADILERITDAFVSLDSEWRYTYVNAKAAQIFGRRPEDMIGRHIWTEFPEGSGQPFYHASLQAAAAQTPIHLEEYYPPYDRWFESRIYPSAGGLSIFFQDITEKKRTEVRLAEQARALEDQRLWLESILDRMPIPLVFIEPGTARVLFANRAADEMAGGKLPRGVPTEDYRRAYAVTDAKGRPLPEESMPGVRVARGDRIETSEINWQTPGGRRTLIVSGDLLPGMHGHDPVALLVFQDISERRRAERLLDESQQRYKSLFDFNADAVFSFDLAGTFLSANAACESVSGHAPEELIGTSFVPLIVPEDRETVLQLFVLAREGQPQTYETTITHKDGQRVPIAVNVVPTVVDNVIVGVYGIAKDITERSRAERAERDAALRQHAFLRDVLASVTEGRLTLCDGPDDLPVSLTPYSETIRLSLSGGLRELRHETQAAARIVGVPQSRADDLITAVSEAGMNAVVHVGEGTGQVFADTERGTIQARIVDYGPGIALENLPNATLRKGFTTAGTLGHGMKMMLATADRIYLLTGGMGTTVVIEQDRVAPAPVW